jgi:cytosine deaminase
MRAMQIAYCTFRRDEDIELAPDAATYGGSRALGREPYGAAPGAPDYLVVVAAHIAAEAVLTCPVHEFVLEHAGAVGKTSGLCPIPHKAA